LHVVVAYASELDFANTANLYGLFKSKRDALRALKEIAEDQGLCHAVIGLEKVKPGAACFGRQLRKCRGACVGEEPRLAHDTRLMAGLARLKISTWPFNGPAYFKEGEEMLLVENWAYLGSATREDEVWDIIASADAVFDQDAYKILSKIRGHLKPLQRA
jgi:DNA polymerase-3 subunit epsilon